MWVFLQVDRTASALAEEINKSPNGVVGDPEDKVFTFDSSKISLVSCCYPCKAASSWLLLCKPNICTYTALEHQQPWWPELLSSRAGSWAEAAGLDCRMT